MLGTSEQTVKISKADFTKTGHTAISKFQWVGFSTKKAGCDKSEKWRKKIISFLGLFSSEPPACREHYINSVVPNAPFLYSLKTSENCKVF